MSDTLQQVYDRPHVALALQTILPEDAWVHSHDLCQVLVSIKPNWGSGCFLQSQCEVACEMDDPHAPTSIQMVNACGEECQQGCQAEPDGCLVMAYDITPQQ